jgi:hypothetical protein
MAATRWYGEDTDQGSKMEFYINTYSNKKARIITSLFCFRYPQTNFSRIFAEEKLSTFADSQKPIAKLRFDNS